MDLYKKASKEKLRFQTNRGVLTVEQLWDLDLKTNDLSNAIKSVKKILKKNDDDELSFLEDTKVVDVENQLRFDILKDVYLTKKQEDEERTKALKDKGHNEKIMAIMSERKDEELRSMPYEELEKLLK